jgi:hypothetical protein
MKTVSELFSDQISRVIEKKFHIMAKLSESEFINGHIMPLKQLLNKYNIDATVRENRIPLLIVVPHTIVPLSFQLDSIMMDINKKKLEYIIKPEWFTNAQGISTPNKPYVLLDVETGYAMINTTPKKCVQTFHDEGRFALTIDEGLSLITHFPEVLASHWLDLPGSELIHKCAGQDARKRGQLGSLPPAFGMTTFIPTLYYKYYDNLMLYYINEATETPYSGSASCGQRLSL